jgi:hypothetical protein
MRTMAQVVRDVDMGKISLGDAWREMSEIYSMMTEEERRVDYLEAMSDLGAVCGRVLRKQGMSEEGK